MKHGTQELQKNYHPHTKIIIENDYVEYTQKNDKVLKYIHKYKKIMKYITHCGLLKAQFNFHPKNIFHYIQIKRLIRALEHEDYETRKQFVEAICDCFNIEKTESRFGKINQHLFKKIVIPVYTAEYKKGNKKYIKLIWQCDNLCNPEKNNLLKQIVFGDGGDYFALIEYNCGKSFMLDKDQKTLDFLMKEAILDIFIFRSDSPGWVHQPDRYFELLIPFANKLERCKEYCKISGNDKWDKFLAEWELLVTHLYKYEEYVRNNGYIAFNDYLKEVEVNIDLKSICTYWG